MIDSAIVLSVRKAKCANFGTANMVYFLKHKSDTTEATEKFLADNAPFRKIKRIQSNNGTEFTS